MQKKTIGIFLLGFFPTILILPMIFPTQGGFAYDMGTSVWYGLIMGTILVIVFKIVRKIRKHG